MSLVEFQLVLESQVLLAALNYCWERAMVLIGFPRVLGNQILLD